MQRCLYFTSSNILSYPRWLPFAFLSCVWPVFGSFLPCLLVPTSLSFRQVSAPETSIFSPQFKREKVHFQLVFSSSLIPLNVCGCFRLLPPGLACPLCPLFRCLRPPAAPIIRVTDVGAVWKMGPFLHSPFFCSALHGHFAFRAH